MKINILSTATRIFAFLFVLSMLSAGCKKDKSPEEGSMKVRMTDAPADYEALMLNITRVEAYHEGEGWAELATDVGMIDILSLSNGREVTIANQSKLSVGTYTMLRLSFGSDSYVSFESGGVILNANLNIQSEAIVEAQFEVEAEATTDILIDFQAGKSLIENAGTFFLDPVITYVEDEETGVEGKLEASAEAFVEITAQGNSASWEAYTDADGSFLIRGLESGIYDCEIFPRNTDMYPNSITVENVTVVEGEITNMGTVQLQ